MTMTDAAIFNIRTIAIFVLLLCNYQALWHEFLEHLLVTFRSYQASMLSLTCIKEHVNRWLIL